MLFGSKENWPPPIRDLKSDDDISKKMLAYAALIVRLVAAGCFYEAALIL